MISVKEDVVVWPFLTALSDYDVTYKAATVKYASSSTSCKASPDYPF